MSNDAIWTVQTDARRFEVRALSKKEAEQMAKNKLAKHENIMWIKYKGGVK